MWRGAKVGAASLGIFSFISGITLCVAFHLPFPPIAVTELGVLLGGLLGAMAGYSWLFPTGRGALLGLLGGSLLGLPLAGLLAGQVKVLVWLASALMGLVLGYQAGCVKPVVATESSWKLHR